MDPCIQTLKRLLKRLEVKHTFECISDIVLTHPDSPSLLTIAEALKSFKIESLAVIIDFKMLLNMSLPCIAQIKRQDHDFVNVIEKIDAQSIIYNDEKNTY